MQLQGKVAVVTGAGSGIGRALARELDRRGCRLALFDVDEAGLAETARTLPAGTMTARLDVSDAQAVTAAAADVVTTLGAVDLVINNAGIAHGGRPFWELPVEDFERVLAVNFGGVVNGSRAFLPHLMARPEATLVNISSLFGIIGVTRQSAYCASKFAVRGLTESLRMELRESAPHVRTVCVHPGGVKTAIARSALLAGRDPAAHGEEAEAFDKIARTSPESAAKTIVDGVVAGRERVLVGPDAKALDLIARRLPRRYTGLLLAGLKRAGGTAAPLAGGLPEVTDVPAQPSTERQRTRA